MVALSEFIAPAPDEMVDGVRAVTARERVGPGVTVVIPTLNERENLPVCLNALMPQLTDSDEVIVVDGGSADETVAIARDRGATVVDATGSSIGMARNIGTRKASTEVVASTDADAIPPEGWVEQIRSHFASDPGLAVLWGTIEDKNGVPIRNLVGKFSTVTGGASGNNTAFRKTAFNQLTHQYPDVNFMEDVVIINRLSKVGKTRRDRSLKMVMNMDRRRYQTVPMVGIGAACLAGGHYLASGVLGELLKGAGIGLAGTELSYESATETPLHHDQVGAIVAAMGAVTDTKWSTTLTGAGAGMVAHHDATEGISIAPTDRERHTDEVVDGVTETDTERSHNSDTPATTHR